MAVVAAPGEREAPSLAGLKTGALGERELNQGVVVPGATFTALAHPRTNTDWSALRVALVEPATGEIKRLGGVVGHRNEGGERLKVERNQVEVGHRLVNAQDAGWVEGELGANLKLGVRVYRAELNAVLIGLLCFAQVKLLGEVGSLARTDDGWAAKKAARVFAPYADGLRVVKIAWWG